ncbi:hypothetical protein CASFOL_009149 [Castilleja foliolosa]|uniref:Uncharacterized protein n=1 Tax=Castilleja foliolosa TaxID=1961234 RepID=A0ABD3DY54_9LAMI
MTQDYEEIAARRAKRENENLNEKVVEKEGPANVGGVEPDDVPEKDDADQGESHPPPAVEEVEPVEVPGKEHEKVAEKEGPANVGGVEPVDVPEKDDADQGESHPPPAVEEVEPVEVPEKNMRK